MPRQEEISYIIKERSQQDPGGNFIFTSSTRPSFFSSSTLGGCVLEPKLLEQHVLEPKILEQHVVPRKGPVCEMCSCWLA
jgi:hypothetical protein